MSFNVSQYFNTGNLADFDKGKIKKARNLSFKRDLVLFMTLLDRFNGAVYAVFRYTGSTFSISMYGTL